jgi:hypothetical protein
MTFPPQRQPHRASEEEHAQPEVPMDVLEYLYGRPEYPPLYKACNTSPKVSFPIYEPVETHRLPVYTPAVSAITLVLRKVEFLSPYEASPARSWRNLIMEINSTQLNFYTIEHVPMLSHVKKSKTKKHYEFTPVEQELICEAINKNPAKYLTQSKLVRSYSLQHARFGIPIDYKKRNTCLRLRCETEQFLVHFISIDEMVLWANYLSIGINVSLDLDSREMPADRVVPRRRRNRRSNRNRAFSDSELIRRELAEPRYTRRASFTGGDSGIKGKLSRMFGKKREQLNLEEITREISGDSLTTQVSSIPEEDEEPEDEVEEEEDIHSIHQLHDSDDDSDSLHEMFASFTLSPFMSPSDEKWEPEPKKYSRRKFLKDSLRCIKLLQSNDSWVGKPCVFAAPPPKFDTCNPYVKGGKSKPLLQCVIGSQGFI